MFQRYADRKFTEADDKDARAGQRTLEDQQDRLPSTRRSLPPRRRLGSGICCICRNPTGIGTGINEAMKAIEAENQDLQDILSHRDKTAWIRISSCLFSAAPH
jgi:hypothetical protein